MYSNLISLINFVVILPIVSTQVKPIVKFDKLWPFIQVFTSCTIHVVRNADPLKLPVYNFEYLCNGNCVHLQSTKYINKAFDHNFLHLSVDIGNGNITLLHRKIFESRYRNVCNVDLVFTTLMEDHRTKVSALKLRMDYEQIVTPRIYKNLQSD